MHYRFFRSGLWPGVLAIVLGLSAGWASAEATAEIEAALRSQPVIRPKSDSPLSAAAREYMKSRDADLAPVWVFFTDKKVFDAAGFEAAAALVTIPGRAAIRRGKVGRADVVFADLPVVDQYLDHMTALGAKIRRTSRWLNAASIEIAHDRLGRIEELAFVAFLRPVVGFSGSRPVDDETYPLPSPPPMRLADVLNYGESAGQLAQIGVTAVHQEGYNAEGVVLAILDSGFRKSHDALVGHVNEGRVLAEWDFVFDDGNTANEFPDDVTSQWYHGTSVWSTAGGCMEGILYGPAYRANFLLAKTEDVRSETPVEEDNWVAALEWADNLGAEVINTSLGYPDWYDYSDLDGATATISIAASTAMGLGIVVCKSVGNAGPSPGTLTPPADAFDILACGAVSSAGTIWSSSSRGPTYDGRTKPEVCAQGVGTFRAIANADDGYGFGNGTSYAAPLVAGAVCLLIQARPDFTPPMVRRAIMETASNADSPNNDYGWGIVDLEAALVWGANFESDVTDGPAPLTIQFYDLSTVTTPTWYWQFGDGEDSWEQEPSHEYQLPGLYDVSLTVESAWGPITMTRDRYVLVSADTLRFSTDSAYAGNQIVASVTLTNSQPLEGLVIPFQAGDGPVELSFDSATYGERTDYFEVITTTVIDPEFIRVSVSLTADVGGGALPLAPGSGEILRLYFSTDPWTRVGQANLLEVPVTPPAVSLTSGAFDYQPEVYSGELRTIDVDCGDVNHDGVKTLADVVLLISYVYMEGDPPASLAVGDINDSGEITLADIVALIDHVYIKKLPIECGHELSLRAR
jgi:PKD repeat protein